MGDEGFGEAVAEFGEESQFRGQVTRQLLLIEAPSPVAAMQAGSIHRASLPKPNSLAAESCSDSPVNTSTERMNAQWMPSSQRPT